MASLLQATHLWNAYKFNISINLDEYEMSCFISNRVPIV